MKRVFAFSLVLLVFGTGCREIAGRRVRGSGEIKTESRNVSSFNSIHVSGAIDVYVKQDSVSSVKVVADDNILEFIEVQVEGSTLEIYTQSGTRLKPSDQIKVYVSNSTFKEFEVSGASNVRSENQIKSTEAIHFEMSGASGGKIDIDAPKVQVNVSGASHIDINGKTRDLDADASGASEIRCFDLMAENTNVEASGASHAEVFASIKIIPHASGASSISYKGSAVVEDKSETGASHVKKAD